MFVYVKETIQVHIYIRKTTDNRNLTTKTQKARGKSGS